MKNALILPVASALVFAGFAATPVLAAPSKPGSADSKVRICHRTNAVTNPYVSIEVAQSSVDGNGGNDKGQGDHYLNHTGPVWTSQTTKKDNWGDIIPPIPGVHGGLNWNAEGQAIWSAGCQPADITDTDRDGLDDIVDPDTDGDNVPDTADTDDDGDGTPDAKDPDESSNVDTDGDGVPDASDSDDDGNGIVDNSECEAPVVEEPPLPPADGEADPGVGTAPTGSSVDTGDNTNNAATGVGQGDKGAQGRSLTTETVGECTPAAPTTSQDTDKDGIFDESDSDQDGDGIPDTEDRDEDGDGIPDRVDADDDNDNTPDVLDPDHTGPEQNPDRTDTDGDGTPDVDDTDIDGDGVPNTSDGDVDGNGQPETEDQTLTSPISVTSVAPVRDFAPALTSLPTLNTRQTVKIDVTCSLSDRGINPRGGINSDELAQYACEVIPGKNPKIALRHDKPTLVTVRVTAPAVGEYEAFEKTLSRVVKPA